MRIISYNVNGLRAVLNKGFLTWLSQANPDIIGLQEIKAKDEQLDLSVFDELGYHYYSHPAEKPGYSGVAFLTKQEPLFIKKGCGIEYIDAEGRIIQINYANFTVLSCYFPSGSSGDARQEIKYKFLEDFQAYIQDLQAIHPNLIVLGDYNICHKAIDIHNPISNANSSGFLPKEREWMDTWFGSGFVDTFRYFNSEPHQYTWWSYRFSAKMKNLGWRIDYISITESLVGQLQRAVILREVGFSDHCPIVAELEL